MFRYISSVFARQVVRRIAVIAVGALFMLIPALWGGYTANAATLYDNAYRTTHSLYLSSEYFECEPVNITENWYTTAVNSTQQGDFWDIQSLDAAINGDGRWIVAQNVTFPNIGLGNPIPDTPSGTPVSDQMYTIIWTEDDSLSLIWNGGAEEYDRTISISGNNLQMAEVYLGDNSCGVYSSWGGADTISGVAGGGSNEVTVSYIHYIYIDENKFNTPAGYTGNAPVENTPIGGYPPPLTAERFAPDWRILTANNWRAEIRDYRFTTFDGIPWTCEIGGNSLINGPDGLAPVIEWELYNENNTVIDEGILSATAHWNYQFPEANEDRTYTIKGRYDCGGEVDFAVIGEKQFTITETGLLKEQDFFADCVMLEPPFVDIPACIENVFRVVEILAFNQVTLVKGLSATENCRQLVVLGHWINKPYEVVCPQFSQTVRNTITPFVTFILGLLTAMLIVRIMNSRGMS